MYYKPGIAATVDRPEVLAEDHRHTSRSSVTVVNVTVKKISMNSHALFKLKKKKATSFFNGNLSLHLEFHRILVHF